MPHKILKPDFHERHVSQGAIESLAAPVGRIITAWSFVDQNVDIWIREVFHLETGSGAKRPGKALADRIKYLKKSQRRLKISPAAAEIADSLIKRIEAAASVRHALAHWALTHFSEQSEKGEGAAIFTKLSYDPLGDPVVEEVMYTVQMLRDQADEMIKLAFILQKINASLMVSR
ncbi:hypothetical protein RHIZ_03750 [Rhizobium skierniewicense]|uniref:DUF1570 domain-containing protein n=1 Tax=Rhizobium skierniewicense TaxID=984260 RepID=UPI001FAB8F54|nr:DUF1570 domain-containing protein [Rhizobium skierniewicense]MCI9865055.1 hypothetical protein [Rhizobium skierniewicense]